MALFYDVAYTIQYKYTCTSNHLVTSVMYEWQDIKYCTVVSSHANVSPKKELYQDTINEWK